MRTRALVVTALLLSAALTGCGGSDDDGARDPGASSTPSEGPDRLPTGKDDLALVTTSHLSPDGFAPELQLDLQYSGTIGWTSVHRGADGFDLAASGVIVAFLTPAEASADEALQEVRAAAATAGARVADVNGWADLGATGIDVRGGDGQLVASRDGGIALDATPGGRLQVFATDQGGSPLVVVVFAPDAETWPEVKAVAERLSSVVFFP